MELTSGSEEIILVTDDNAANIGFIRAILEKSGYRVASAMGGTECIEIAKKIGPALILLDINMPLMSGIEACKLLNQDLQTKNIPVIFVTANTDDGTLKQAFESGGTDYVHKPVNRVELLARIGSALTQQKSTNKLLEEEKLRGVLEMAGAVCHELNQPMQSILGYSQLLLMDISEDNPLYKSIDKIRGQIVRMGKITKKLMGITQYKTREYIGGRNIIDIDQASKGG